MRKHEKWYKGNRFFNFQNSLLLRGLNRRNIENVYTLLTYWNLPYFFWNCFVLFCTFFLNLINCYCARGGHPETLSTSGWTIVAIRFSGLFEKNQVKRPTRGQPKDRFNIFIHKTDTYRLHSLYASTGSPNHETIDQDRPIGGPPLESFITCLWWLKLSQGNGPGQKSSNQKVLNTWLQ